MESCDKSRRNSKLPPSMIPETKPDHELSDGLRKETQDPE